MWWAAFAGFGLLISLWSIAMPLYSSPDEPAHVVKAAAVARGHFLGRDTHNTAGDTLTHFRVPAALVADIPCYAHKKSVTADCQKFRTRSTELVDATTLAGHYPPLYYAIVGLGSDLIPGHRGLYLMRLFSAALNAAFLASALLSIRRWPNGFGSVGLAVAVTPMVVFMSAGVNPSGFEITTAIATWTALLAVLADPGAASTRLVIRLGIAASALTLTRSLSPLWLAVIVVSCCLPAGWSAVKTALSRRDVRLCAATVFVATVAAVAWIAGAGALTLRPNRSRAPLPYLDAVRISLLRTPYRLHQMVGYFGWLDTDPSLWTQVVWVGALAILIVLCVSTARSVEYAAVAAIAVVSLILPSLIEASQEKTLGFVWQGRYTLPISVGVPLLAARFIRIPHMDLAAFKARLTTILVALLMSGQLLAFVWNTRRYTVADYKRIGLTGSLKWHPPLLPVWLYVALFLAGAVFLGFRLLADRDGGLRTESRVEVSGRR